MKLCSLVVLDLTSVTCALPRNAAFSSKTISVAFVVLRRSGRLLKKSNFSKVEIANNRALLCQANNCSSPRRTQGLFLFKQGPGDTQKSPSPRPREVHFIFASCVVKNAFDSLIFLWQAFWLTCYAWSPLNWRLLIRHHYECSTTPKGDCVRGRNGRRPSIFSLVLKGTCHWLNAIFLLRVL
ncbi:hypothetical protein MTO96_051954 [Rhipicephalus appendiculatus]